MYACPPCRVLLGAWLSACPRCGGGLQTVGSGEGSLDPASFPQLRQFPLRKTALRVSTAGTLVLPRVRDSIEVWRAHALRRGYTSADIEPMTKAQLLALFRSPDDPDDEGLEDED